MTKKLTKEQLEADRLALEEYWENCRKILNKERAAKRARECRSGFVEDEGIQWRG